MNIVSSVAQCDQRRPSFNRQVNFKNYKQKKTCISNYLSVDLNTENSQEVDSLAVKHPSNFSDINKLRRKSIQINDSLLTDVNESRFDNEKLNDMKLCNDAHKMLVEFGQIINDNQDISTLIEKKDCDITALKNIQEEANDQDRLNDSLETVNIPYNPVNLREMLEQSKNEGIHNIEKDLISYSNYKRINNSSNFHAACASKILSKLGFNKNISGRNCSLSCKEAAQEMSDISFNHEHQAELKSEIISDLGKLLFDSIYEIIEHNTPYEYFHYEEEKLSKLILHKLSQQFLEDKIKIGISRILDIYKLIFAKREDSKKMPIS